jgi:hypothetical protein
MAKHEIVRMLQSVGLEFEEYPAGEAIYKHDPQKYDTVVYVNSRGICFAFKEEYLVDLWSVE